MRKLMFFSKLLISDDCIFRLKSNQVDKLQCIAFVADDKICPLLLQDEADRQNPFFSLSQDVVSFRFEMPVFIADDSLETLSVELSEFLSQLTIDSSDMNQIVALTSAYVVIARNKLDTAYYCTPSNNQATARRIYHFQGSIGVRSGRDKNSIGKKVAVIGCGSIGSKVAESLIRSGITNISLVDGDIFLPGNLARNNLDWRDVGLHKAGRLKNRLLQICPGALIQEFEKNLNWQRSSETHAGQVSALADCDVIVDATGDPSTSLFLGAIASANSRPFVSIEVYEGGIGALIASCLPLRDPPYAQARSAFFSWCEAQGKVPPEPSTKPYEALSEGIPLVADDAAVTIAAGHGSRVILDILDEKPAPNDSAWLLIGFKKAWVFEEGHGDIIKLSVGAPESLTQNLQNQNAQDFINQLVQEALNAAKDKDRRN